MLLAGITVTNFAYITISSAFALLVLPIPNRRRFKLMTAYFTGVLVLFGVFSSVHARLYPEEFNLFSRPVEPLGSQFLRFDRSWVDGALLTEARFFAYNNIVASTPEVRIVDTLTGHQQMIQMGAVGRPEYFILAYFAMFLVLPFGKKARGRIDAVGVLALAFLVFTFLLHFFFRGNGQPFIFSTQTVLPLIVLLALFYGKSRFRLKKVMLAGLVLSVVVNNAWFIRDVNYLLWRPCVSESDRGHDKCLRWANDATP